MLGTPTNVRNTHIQSAAILGFILFYWIWSNMPPLTKANHFVKEIGYTKKTSRTALIISWLLKNSLQNKQVGTNESNVFRGTWIHTCSVIADTIMAKSVRNIHIIALLMNGRFVETLNNVCIFKSKTIGPL